MSGGRAGEIRVCVVGDELVAGVGDRRGLGWVGRVVARTPQDEQPLAVFPLGIPGETTAGLVDRWRQETNRRFDDVAGASRLVLGLGRGDVLAGVSLARSRLNLANILDEAHARRLPTFVVGPPPTLTPAVNDGLRQLSAAFGDVCHRRGVPFVDSYRPLETHDDWLTDLSAGDGTHPGQAGYGLIAWLVLHGGWHAWLGLER